MAGAVFMGAVLVFMGLASVYLVSMILRGYRNERRKDSDVRLWKHFGLSIAFASLFFISWIGQGVAQWQEYTDDAAEHGQQASMGDFMGLFSSATLENWQSEFLQLFSFVVLSAVLIHKGSAESKDSDERIEAKLDEIEKALGIKHQETEEGAEK